jgi:hypothetical protein
MAESNSNLCRSNDAHKNKKDVNDGEFEKN